MNTYKSIVPSEMTNKELKAICTDIQTAKNWNLSHATVKLTNGNEYKVDVTRHRDYMNEFETITSTVKQ